MKHLAIQFIVWAALIGATAHSTSAALRAVTLSGQHAPGTPAGITFSGTASPALNAAGRTGFKAFLTGTGVTDKNNEGVWSEGVSGLRLIARAGDAAPGTGPNVTFGVQDFVLSPAVFGFSAPTLNRFGQSAFLGTLQHGSGGVTTTNRTGIWAESGGALNLIARAGEPAPGTASGRVFDSFGGVTINAVGGLAVTASTRDAAGVVDFATGIWTKGSGPLTLLAGPGMQPPGTPPGTKYSNFGFIGFNDAGKAAFKGFLQSGTGGVNDANNSGIWSTGSGVLSLVARENEQAPDVPAGAQFSDFGGHADFSSAGRVAFIGNLQLNSGGVNLNNFQGIWSDRNGTLQLVTRTGDQAPGALAGARFNSFAIGDYLGVNASGHIAFEAEMRSGIGGVSQNNDGGIWSTASGPLTIVARENTTPPGAPGAAFDIFNNIVLNAAGQVAFASILKDSPSVNSTNNVGLWAQDRGGVLKMVARTGNQLQIAPGDSRTIRGLFFAGGDGGGFNDLGELTFGAAFTNGTFGMFVADVTAPAIRRSDFTGDGVVNGQDLNSWRGSFAIDAAGDSDSDGDSDGADFMDWQRHVGTFPIVVSAEPVPEPTTLAMLLVGVVFCYRSKMSSSRR